MNISFLDLLNNSSDNSLRDYQQINKHQIYDSWKVNRGVMLQMPTGTGKTRLFSSILNDIQRFNSNNNHIRCLVLVHRVELIEQIVSELKGSYNLQCGVIQAGYRQNPDFDIQVASVQTLSRRLDKWVDNLFDFIVVDEAHHVPAESYKKIIGTFTESKVLGVTATPYRLSGEGFTDIFDELIISPSVKEFIERGFLSKYDYYSVRYNSDVPRELSTIKHFQNGEYTDADMSRICDNSRIRAQVVETYLKYAQGKKGIVYTINREHNFHLCNDFINNGVKAVAIDSQTPSELRKKYIEQFKSGLIDIICNVNIFSEGFDCPDIQFIQLARPTQSLSMFLQQVGRGLRPTQNKSKCLFLDNVGLYYRFGLPSANRKWLQHFLGQSDEDLEPKESKGTGRIRKRPDLSEGHEEIHLIETISELKSEKKWAFLIFDFISKFNNFLIHRDDLALNYLQDSFSNKGECVLSFDGSKVSVWKNSGDKKSWDANFYLKNFKFRFDNESETRTLIDEAELNRWLTNRFLAIREKIDINTFNSFRKDATELNFDKTTLIEQYDRWFDNDSEKPFAKSEILGQLVGQTYDFLFLKDSGNRVFNMIMQMPKDKRIIAFSRR